MFCPKCGFLVIEWDVDSQGDKDCWRWSGKNAEVNSGKSLPKAPIYAWGKGVPNDALVSLAETEIDFDKLKKATSKQEERKRELDEIKSTPKHDLWATPAFDSVKSIPLEFEKKFRHAVLLLLTTPDNEIIKTFTNHLRDMGIPNEKKRWLRGSNEDMIQFIGQKIERASNNSEYKHFQVEQFSSSVVCPIIKIVIFKQGGTFSDCWVAKADDDDLCALDGLHPSLFN